ncbi:MAG TPA: PAS domain S-box protein, partial [Sideroxyarcus sp.]|nr:PAS domain S-box protein [Sideroxyarcus sp.]
EGYQQVFQNGFVTDYPLALRHRDGHVTDVLYNASVYRDEKGEVLGVFAAARDVTERNKAEAALRESEAVLQTTMKILPVGLWVFDAEGKIVFSNDAARHIWAGARHVGIEQLGEYKGWRLDSGRLVGPHEWAGARALEKGETSLEEEIEIECFDGTRKIILDSAVPLRSSNGSVRGAVTVNQDITERKELETRLRQSSAYTRSLIEASLDPLVTISSEGKITDVNQATENVTGSSRSELIGTDFSDYFTEPDKAREGYQQVFQKGFVTDYPLALRHRDGHVTEVLYNASVYRNEAGEVLGVFAAARDVTERNKAEREVSQLSLRNRLILDSMGEGIYGLDIDGRCTFANPAAAQLFGFSVEELLGQQCHALFHHTKPDGSPYPVEECPIQSVYKQGAVHRGSDLYWRKDGSSFPVEFISTPILEAAKITGAVVAFRDITELKLAEEQLRRSEHGLAEAQRIAHLGNWELDLVRNVLTWSDEIYRIFEIDPERFGASYEAFLNGIHPDDREMVNIAYTES